MGEEFNGDHSTIFDYLQKLKIASKLNVWIIYELSEKVCLKDFLLAIVCYHVKSFSIFQTNSNWWWKMGVLQ